VYRAIHSPGASVEENIDFKSKHREKYSLQEQVYRKV
jgi:hypothetical protein